MECSTSKKGITQAVLFLVSLTKHFSKTNQNTHILLYIKAHTHTYIHTHTITHTYTHTYKCVTSSLATITHNKYDIIHIQNRGIVQVLQRRKKILIGNTISQYPTPTLLSSDIISLSICLAHASGSKLQGPILIE